MYERMRHEWKIQFMSGDVAATFVKSLLNAHQNNSAQLGSNEITESFEIILLFVCGGLDMKSKNEPESVQHTCEINEGFRLTSGSKIWPMITLHTIIKRLLVSWVCVIPVPIQQPKTIGTVTHQKPYHTSPVIQSSISNVTNTG